MQMHSTESGELGDQYNQSEPSTRVKAPGRRRRRRADTALPSSLHFLIFRCGRWRRARSSRSELRFPTWMWFYFPFSLSSILWRADSQPRRCFAVGVKRSLRRDGGPVDPILLSTSSFLLFLSPSQGAVTGRYSRQPMLAYGVVVGLPKSTRPRGKSST
ncbi:hypothetical protein D4764_03G0011200 [Takifugu flavidus]|uniref:Uncharacterized protein n=1 Tax=Takifugu flavidus TaxID=433684 RepID=A0A5C6N9E7_9TELE|nr:hypothetical protein D4764_03G0011200 [Takifugu flavidus]